MDYMEYAIMVVQIMIPFIPLIYVFWVHAFQILNEWMKGDNGHS